MNTLTETRPEVELLIREAHLAKIRYDLDAARSALQKAIALDKKTKEAWQLLYELDGVTEATEEVEPDDDESIAPSPTPPNPRRRGIMIAAAASVAIVGVLLTFVPYHQHGESYLAAKSLHDRYHLNWFEDILLGSAIGFGILGAIYLRTQSSVDEWE